MSELTTYFGPLGSGKSGRLITKYLDFKRQNLATIVAKPALDTKTGKRIGSRIGKQIKQDFLIAPDIPGGQLYDELAAREKTIWERDFSQYNKVTSDLEKNVHTLGLKQILIDEAQFLTPDQVTAIYFFAVQHNIPVDCYGIATDFRTETFPGSHRLFAVSHRLEMMHGICRCGEPTQFNARTVHGKFVFDGDPVAIQGKDGVDYVSLCGRCYIDEGGKVLL